MRIKVGRNEEEDKVYAQNKEDEMDRLERWHKWFAWYPVNVGGCYIYWLCYMERRQAFHRHSGELFATHHRKTEEVEK